MSRAVAIVLLLAAAGCDLDLERMIDQPHYTTYEACETCPDGTIMMMPPAGTVPRGTPRETSELAQGRMNGAYVERIPLALDERVFARGRNRFDIYCAACHGRLANGVSQVAENMTLRPPPNLLAEPYPSYPPGRVFTVITEGFGLMRSYAADVPVEDRWAIVAYLQALQLSQHVALRELPPAIKKEASTWLK
jgi:mono/diheme cytochrome c family protein